MDEKPTKRQIILNWLMGENDLSQPDGWWATSDGIARVDALIEQLERAQPAAPKERFRTVWLVEAFHEGKSDGYWIGTPKDNGGWRTENAWAAKQYTESEAKAVAAALDYFPTPFKWSHWVATEHVFSGVDDYVHAGPLAAQPVAAQGTDGALQKVLAKIRAQVLPWVRSIADEVESAIASHDAQLLEKWNAENNKRND